MILQAKLMPKFSTRKEIQIELFPKKFQKNFKNFKNFAEKFFRKFFF